MYESDPFPMWPLCPLDETHCVRIYTSCQTLSSINSSVERGHKAPFYCNDKYLKAVHIQRKNRFNSTAKFAIPQRYSAKYYRLLQQLNAFVSSYTTKRIPSVLVLPNPTFSLFIVCLIMCEGIHGRTLSIFISKALLFKPFT